MSTIPVFQMFTHIDDAHFVLNYVDHPCGIHGIGFVTCGGDMDLVARDGSNTAATQGDGQIWGDTQKFVDFGRVAQS